MTKFENSIIGMLHPNWDDVSMSALVKSKSQMAPSTFIYLIDVCSGWNSVAAVDSDVFDSAKEELSGFTVDAVKTNLASILSYICRPTSTVSKTSLQDAYRMAAAFLSRTKAYQSVLDAKGTSAGHWFFLGYRLYDGTYAGHPAFQPLMNQAPLTQKMFRKIQHDVLKLTIDSMNQAEQGCDFGAELLRGGGPILTPFS